MKTFSFDTVENFDEHIELSIPNYNHIFDLIKSMSLYFIQKDTNVYDLGCSTGLLLRNLSIDNKIENVEFTGYEISENLRPKKPIYGYNWIKNDIRDIVLNNTNLVFSIFTLQFLSIEDRIKVINNVYDSLNKGGAFIVCEKTYAERAFIQDIFTFSYYDYKEKTFSNQEILTKQKDLRSIMRPLSNEENLELFKEAGFKKVDTFFQSLSFYGYILIK